MSLIRPLSFKTYDRSTEGRLLNLNLPRNFPLAALKIPLRGIMEDLFLDTSSAAFLFPIPFGSYGVGLSLLVDSLDISDG